MRTRLLIGYLALILFTNYFLLFTSPIFAHTLKSDGSIGAVIHIDPEDDPIIDEPANFFFEFKDTENKFNPTDCTCLVTVSKAGQEFFSEQLETSTQEPSLTSASFSFTFPEKGVYQVKVAGTPTATSSFEPFEITYDLRVDRESSSNPGQNFIEENLHWLIIGIAVLIFGGALLTSRSRK